MEEKVNKINKLEFGKQILALAVIFGKREEINEVVLEMYYNTISEELTKEEFNKANNIILKTRKFGNMPTPGEIITTIKGEQGNKRERKLNLATTKFRQILNCGYSIKCDDPYIVQTILIMGGLEDIRRTDIDKITWLEKEFKEKYEVQLGEKLRSDLPTRLLNWGDTQNERNGYGIMGCKIIGDKDKYLKWTSKLKKVTSNSNLEKIEKLNCLKNI